MTVAVLRANMELNGISNVDVRQVAAWDERATLRLEEPERANQRRVDPGAACRGGYGFAAGPVAAPGHGEVVPLDEVFCG